MKSTTSHFILMIMLIIFALCLGLGIFIVHDQLTDITNESNTGYYTFVLVLFIIGLILCALGFGWTVYDLTFKKRKTEKDEDEDEDEDKAKPKKDDTKMKKTEEKMKKTEEKMKKTEEKKPVPKSQQSEYKQAPKELSEQIGHQDLSGQTPKTAENIQRNLMFTNQL